MVLVFSAFLVIIVTKVIIAFMFRLLARTRVCSKSGLALRIVVGRYGYKSSFGANNKEIIYFQGCLIEDGIDYHDVKNSRHQDIKVKRTANQQACADLSATTVGGLFWTWNKNNKNCIVKSSDSGKKTLGHAVSGNRACGKKHCFY